MSNIISLSDYRKRKAEELQREQMDQLERIKKLEEYMMSMIALVHDLEARTEGQSRQIKQLQRSLAKLAKGKVEER